MKRLLATLILLTLPLTVRAAYIAETGLPLPGVTYGEEVYFNQFLAANFNVETTCTINSLEGYFAINRPGVLTAVLYGNLDGTDLGRGGIVPDVSNPLYVKEFSIDSMASDWYGIFEVNTVLTPGSYWLAFEDRPGNTFSGNMPSPVNNPLENYAYTYQGKYYNYFLRGGYRIDASPYPPTHGEDPAPVPEPATLLLMASGALGLVPVSRKFKKSA